MEFIVITDKYCVLHMWQKQSWCDLNMQKAPKKLWQLRLPCDILKILRCDKLWLAIKHESHLWNILAHLNVLDLANNLG